MSRAYLNGAGNWSDDASCPSPQQRIAELEVIFEAVPIGIFLCDRNCRFIRVNRRLADMDGTPASEHAGRLIWDVIPALRESQEPIFCRVLDHGEAVHKLQIQGRASRKTGITPYWEASYHPIYGADDDIVAICGIVDEITDRKIAEKERINSEARLRRLLNANLFGVATADPAGIIEANDAFLVMVGYTRDELQQRRIGWNDITPPERSAGAMEALERLKTSGICPGFEMEYIRKDGRHFPVLVAATVLDQDPLRWIAFVIDITERKAQEEHARELMAEMAHRTKNLMAVVSAIANQLALTSGNFEEFSARFAARLKALAGIHDILVRGDWRGASVRELVLSQLAHCADLLESRIHLRGPPVVLSAAVCQSLGMALHELSTNALKHGSLSGGTGTVTITWDLIPSANPDRFTLDWIEKGGPAVSPPGRQGFGHTVTTHLIERAIDARVSAQFTNEGFHWSMTMPWLRTAREQQEPGRSPSASSCVNPADRPMKRSAIAGEHDKAHSLDPFGRRFHIPPQADSAVVSSSGTGE